MYREVLCIKRKEIPMSALSGQINSDMSAGSTSAVQFRGVTGGEGNPIEEENKKIALVSNPEKTFLPKGVGDNFHTMG